MAHVPPSLNNSDSAPQAEHDITNLPKDDQMKVAIIGAGPSGLVTLKYLSTAHHYFPIDPIEVICIEAETDLGGTFKYRVYEDAEASLSPFPSQNPSSKSKLTSPDPSSSRPST